MKKITFLLLLIGFQQIIYSQVISDKISVEFKNANLKTVIQNIEQVSYYKFYFDEKWLATDSTALSREFKEEHIAKILEDVFQNTSFNYLITDKKIILTNNSIIYNELSDDYFGIPLEKNEKEEKVTPVFYQQYNSLKKTNSRDPNQNIKDILFIGKEVKDEKKKTYVLSGYVRGKNKEGISNVILKIPNTDFITTTDKNGFYKLQVPAGMCTVETETFSYDKVTKNIMVYNDGVLNFNVTDNVNQLDEVLVNNKSKNIKAAITGVTTIDSEGIKNVPLVLGERDILKVALTLPGIKTSGEGSAGYNVRGGKEDQNLFLLDHAVLYNPSHFFGFFTALNPYTTKKLDIYKGSIPAEFGGRLSSVFDITSKTGNFDKLEGEGGIGPVTSNVMISTPIVKEKSSLVVGARASYSDWILKKLDDENLKDSEASFYDLILRYNHKINTNNDIESTAYYSHDKFSVSSDSLYKYSNSLATLKWNHSFNEKNKGSLILTHSGYKFNIDYQPEEGTNSFDFGYKINETQLALKMAYLYNEKHKFSYGISSKLYNIDPGYLEPKNPESILIPVDVEKERGLESAIYIGDNFKINDKFLLDLGLRYSFFAALGKSDQRIYEKNLPISDATVIETKTFGPNEVIKNYGGLEPRIAARYFLADNFSVRASYDKTYQYIHLLSNNTTQSPTDIWKLTDLNIKPESSQQLSLGFFKNLNNGKIELSLEGYYKKSENILDYKVGSELLLNENIETELLQGEGKAYGIELLVKKQTGRLNGWLGYTYSRSLIKLDSQFNEEKVNDGKYFASNFDKPHDFSAVMNYRITKRYSFSSNFTYQTGRPITYPTGTYDFGNAQYTVYSDRNKFRIPDYYRLDIGFNIEGNHKIKKLAHSFWNISVYNVLGRNNPYSVFFVTDKGQIKAYKTSIFSIPIPSITYNFKF